MIEIDLKTIVYIRNIQFLILYYLTTRLQCIINFH